MSYNIIIAPSLL